MLVTPVVNAAILPTTPAENAVTVFVTEAAASEPGRRGRVIVLDLPPLGTEDVIPRATEPPIERLVDELLVAGTRLILGSTRHHQ